MILSFQRRYQQIIQEFEEKRKSRKIDDPALLILVAKARIRCEDYSGALEELNSVIDLGVRNDPQIYLQRGICYENLEKWDAASAEFSQCITLIPTYAKAYYHRGLCKLYTGDISGSGVRDLDVSIEFDPKFFDAFITRATYCHSQGNAKLKVEQYPTSIEDCNSALMLEPTSVRALLLRGASKCKLNQYSRSILDFTKATSLDRVSFK